MQDVWCHLAGRSIMSSSGDTNEKLQRWWNHTFPLPSLQLTGAGVRHRVDSERLRPVHGFHTRTIHTIEPPDSRRRRAQQRREQKKRKRAMALSRAKFDVATTSLGSLISRNQLARRLIEASDLSHADKQDLKASHPVNLRHVYQEIHDLAKSVGAHSSYFFSPLIVTIFSSTLRFIHLSAGAPLGDSDIEQVDTRRLKDANGKIIAGSYGKMVNNVSSVVNFLLQKSDVNPEDVALTELVLWGDGVKYGRGEVTGAFRDPYMYHCIHSNPFALHNTIL